MAETTVPSAPHEEEAAELAIPHPPALEPPPAAALERAAAEEKWKTVPRLLIALIVGGPATVALEVFKAPVMAWLTGLSSELRLHVFAALAGFCPAVVVWSIISWRSLRRGRNELREAYRALDLKYRTQSHGLTLTNAILVRLNEMLAARDAEIEQLKRRPLPTSATPEPEVLHGARMVFRYETTAENTTTITRTYEGITVPDGRPLSLPFTLNFLFAKDATIESVDAPVGPGAHFAQRFDPIAFPEHATNYSTTIQLTGRHHEPVSVTVVARVKNAFAQTAKAAEERPRGGVPPGHEFQEWAVGASSWDELYAVFTWPDTRRFANEVLTIEKGLLPEPDRNAATAIQPCSPLTEVGKEPPYFVIDHVRSRWEVKLVRVRPPMRALVTWRP